MLKSFKYRIYPSDGQKRQIETHFSCCRLVWNLALEVKKANWDIAKINIKEFELHRQLTELKRENKWLYEANAQSLQQTIRHLDEAFKGFFSGKGYPKFKKKYGRQSFKCTQKIKAGINFITIPKIGSIRYENSRPLNGILKSLVISRAPTNKYFASLLIENGKELPSKLHIDVKKTLGIDCGIKSFVMPSVGLPFESNRFLKKSLDRLRCLQKRVSRKKKGSKNRKKANLRVALLHEKITNQRADYIHKITTGLVRDSQATTFVMEDLNIVGMLKNRPLSRSLQDASFGEFVRQMKYKCEWYGKNFIQIGRFEPSSKMCSECQAINETLTLADREWTCANCGTNHDRDLNAAKNIKRIGLEKYTGRGTSGEPVESRRIRRAKKQA